MRPKPLHWDEEDKLANMDITTKHKVRAAAQWLKQELEKNHYHTGEEKNELFNMIDEAFGMRF